MAKLNWNVTTKTKFIIITTSLLLIFQSVDCLKYSSKYNENVYQKSNSKIASYSNVSNDGEDETLSSGILYEGEKRKEEPSAENREANYSIENVWPVRIFNCVGHSGVSKCLKIFLLRRMNRVVEALKDNRANVTVEFDVKDEIERDFKWEDYKRVGDKDIDKMLFKNLKGLMENRVMKLVIRPGVDVEVLPAENGSVIFNIKKDPDLHLPRGMKMPKKAFYRIVPMLLIPPLIMSAILPFVLPAMKMMVIGVGMLNQMALMGAIFTLMRNNAFHETGYEKKVIYINSGYKNEKKHPPVVRHHEQFHSKPHNDHNEFHTMNIPHFHGQETYKSNPHISTVDYVHEHENGGDDDDGESEHLHFDHGGENFNMHAFGQQQIHGQYENHQYRGDESFNQGPKFSQHSEHDLRRYNGFKQQPSNIGGY